MSPGPLGTATSLSIGPRDGDKGCAPKAAARRRTPPCGLDAQEHDKFFDVVKNFDAIVVRCNPGPSETPRPPAVASFPPRVPVLAVSGLLFPTTPHAAPGQIKADGGDQGKFDNSMREIRKKGIQVLLRGQVCKVKVS